MSHDPDGDRLAFAEGTDSVWRSSVMTTRHRAASATLEHLQFPGKSAVYCTARREGPTWQCRLR